ncbi:MAG: murein L,D-transpeptidase catalytic domain-containing protein, partial [Bacteroidota bacterium]
FGKFKVGNPYAGNFGTAYKIYGLDSSNNNAFNRNIVLHSYTCVPEQETDPIPICNSRGCPMISPGFMEQLKPLINQSKKPILLWIFE